MVCTELALQKLKVWYIAMVLFLSLRKRFRSLLEDFFDIFGIKGSIITGVSSRFIFKTRLAALYDVSAPILRLSYISKYIICKQYVQVQCSTRHKRSTCTGAQVIVLVVVVTPEATLASEARVVLTVLVL